MRRKVSTILDEAVFRRAKLEAARQGRPISEIFEEALGRYLAAAGTGSVPRSVAETWSAMAVSPEVLRGILDEDDWIDA
jgi:hypothetical protein